MERLLRKVAFGAVGLSLVAGTASMSLFNVDGGEAAIMLNKASGIQDKVYTEGTHFRVPVLEDPIIFDIRTKPRNISTTTGSKDLQTVNITLRVLYKPDISHLPYIYKTFSMDYDERVLPSIGNEVMKAVVAQYNAEELITKRAQISQRIRDILRERAAEFKILFEDISITHLTFSKEFTQAVESKQVAQQDAERYKYVVLKATQEKRANIIKAEGEAVAANLISEALKSGPALIELRRIEAAREIAQALAENRNVVYLPKGGNYMMAVGGAGAAPQQQK